MFTANGAIASTGLPPAACASSPVMREPILSRSMRSRLGVRASVIRLISPGAAASMPTAQYCLTRSTAVSELSQIARLALTRRLIAGIAR